MIANIYTYIVSGLQLVLQAAPRVEKLEKNVSGSSLLYILKKIEKNSVCASCQG